MDLMHRTGLTGARFLIERFGILPPVWEIYLGNTFKCILCTFRLPSSHEIYPVFLLNQSGNPRTVLCDHAHLQVV